MISIAHTAALIDEGFTPMTAQQHDEDIVDAEIVDDDSDTDEHDAQTNGRELRPTVAFFVDPRAATLLLAETVEDLVRSRDVEHALVDVTSPVGQSVARGLRAAGVAYTTVEYAPYPEKLELAPDPVRDELSAGASDHVVMDIGRLGAVDANIVLVPAMIPGFDFNSEPRIDFSPQTLVGQVLTQTEKMGREVLVVDLPERGMLPKSEDVYRRRIIRVQLLDDSVDD